MDDLKKYVPNVHFELIPIKNLVSNQDYQRSISVKRVKQGVENFDLYKVNPVKISQRDGQNYVIDGQHTIEMVATVSGSRDTPVWCMIYDDMDYIIEADLFARQQEGVKPLTPYEIFNANIEAQNDIQLFIKDLVESYGLRARYCVPRDQFSAAAYPSRKQHVPYNLYPPRGTERRTALR